MRKASALVTAALLALCAGCSPSKIADKLTPADVQAGSKEAVSDLRAREFGKIKRILTDDLKTPNLDEALKQMADGFPAGDIKSAKLVGSLTEVNGGDRTVYKVTYEYEFKDRWVLVYFV